MRRLANHEQDFFRGVNDIVDYEWCSLQPHSHYAHGCDLSVRLELPFVL